MDSKHQPDEGQQLALYRQMLTIRRFEERCNYLYMQGRIPSTLHLYIGQEAVAVGVCANLTAEDYVTSTHRPHGHAIAKGVSMRAIMAELFARRTGCCKGKGGSMHVGDVQVGMFPAIAIVGGGIPVATGAALACKRLVGGRVSVAFFGEGATNEGAFHEALNMAALWQLPAIFVCENNLYEVFTTAKESCSVQDIAVRGAGYGMPGEVVDGNDVYAIGTHCGVRFTGVGANAIRSCSSLTCRACTAIRPRAARRASVTSRIACRCSKRSCWRRPSSRASRSTRRGTPRAPKPPPPRSRRCRNLSRGRMTCAVTRTRRAASMPCIPTTTPVCRSEVRSAWRH